MVAWKSQIAPGTDSLYIGFFLRDQILTAESASPVNIDLRVSQPWPQPAKARFMVDVEMPQTERVIVLECRDVLGRLVMRDERSMSTGRLRLSEDVSGLLPGLYLISIRCGEMMELRKLVVE